MTNEQRRTKVLVLTEHLVLGHGLEALLGKTEDLSVCGVLGVGLEVVDLVGAIRPGVVVVDVPAGGGGRMGFIRELKRRYPRIRVLAFSVCGARVFGTEILEAGADGYVSEPEKEGKLLSAIRELVEEERRQVRTLSVER